MTSEKKTSLIDELNDSMLYWSESIGESDETPFLSFSSFENNVCIKLEKHIAEYKLEKRTGAYGSQNYIKVLVTNAATKPDKIPDKSFHKYLLKVDSKRLRNVLFTISENTKKYPVKINILRTGAGFDTEYHNKYLISKAQMIAVLSNEYHEDLGAKIQDEIDNLNGLIDKDVAIDILYKKLIAK